MGITPGQDWGWRYKYIYRSQKKWELPWSTIFKLESKLEIDGSIVPETLIKCSHKGDIEDIKL